jgi:hypothetical protein
MKLIEEDIGWEDPREDPRFPLGHGELVDVVSDATTVDVSNQVWTHVMINSPRVETKDHMTSNLKEVFTGLL